LETRCPQRYAYLFFVRSMRRVMVLAFSFASAATCLCQPAPHREWPSPDERWLVTCDCKGTWQPDSCSIALSRRSDAKVFFTHHTTDRYIKAVWSSDSTRCVLLDVPDNANSYLWLFRVQGRDIATEKLGYDKISKMIETALPATRPRETPGFITRSGIDAITWLSPRELKLAITYNNVPVIVTCDVAKRHSPKFIVSSQRGT
jgi:hypothetical protein